VQNSQLIQRLKEQEAAVVRRIGELSGRFGARHPKMIDARAELADLRAKIRAEMGRIIQRLRNDQKIAQAREDSLKDTLTKLQDEQAHQVRDQVELHELTRKAELNRKLYEDFLAKVNLATQTTTRRESHVRVIATAQPPVDPSYPRKPVIVALGLVLSGVFGVLLVLLIERLRTGFRTPAQIEEAAQLSLLGTVPRLPRRHLARRDIADFVIEAAGSTYAEAIRSLRTALSVSGPKEPPRVVLVASSLSGEGKTSLVVSLARQAAQSAVTGSVILVDCDLRRPKVAAAMGLDCNAGLMQLFAGEARLEDVILDDPRTGLKVLPAVGGTPNPPELLSSAHMRDLLQELTRRYDLVILDSPALNSVSDARVLARFADATIFVVQWGTTPRNVALAAIRQLQSAGAAIAGIVLHKVDQRTLGLFGYGDAADYQS
jgi:capsular exopolysaccharide synthesis family protein